jgi:branched-chain amino acid transport system substrate-binding protein
MRTSYFLVPCLLVSLGCAAKAPPEPLYIGHLAPRSGPDREVGERTQQAILLAVEEANGADGQVGGRPVVVLHPETYAAGSRASEVAVRLLTVDRAVALLASSDAAEAERLSRLAQQYNAPLLVSASAIGPVLAPFGFSVGLAPSDQGRALARYAFEELKATKVTLIAVGRDTAAAALATAAADELRKRGADVQEPSRPAGEDRTGFVREVVKSEPAAVLVVGSAAEFRKFRDAFRDEKLPADVPLFFGGPEATGLASTAGGNPVYRATAFVADSSLPRAQEFAKRFHGRFHRAADVEAALAYDAARLLFDALGRSGDFRGPKVRDELLQVKDFEVLTGTLSFDGAYAARRPALVVRVEPTRELLVKRYDP